jgi:hypothetical protein
MVSGGSSFMRPEQIRELLLQQPFQPFRLFVSDGTVYDIAHPEVASVLGATVHIDLPANGVLGSLVHRVAIVSLFHIARVEVVVPHRS